MRKPIRTRFHAPAILLMVLALAACEKADFRDGIRAYEQGSYKKAAEIWRPLAREGNMRAQHHLGNLYRGGLGVPRDLARSFHWMERAAKQGHAPSQFTLAYMLDEGMGVERYPKRSFKWYLVASKRVYSVSKRVKARREAKRLAAEIEPDQREAIRKEAQRFRPREASQ